MQIVDFTEKWIYAASQMAVENYQEEKRVVEALPDKPVLPSMYSLTQNGLGVVAVEDDELVGFLGAYGPWGPVFCTQTVHGVFSPIHAHGAKRQNRIRIYQRMYQAAAEKWVRAGASSHAVTLYAHDADAREAFFLYGFGMRCLDLLRQVTPSDHTPVSDCIYYELPADRHSQLRTLRKNLSDHLAKSPCFMLDAPEATDSWIQRKEVNPPRVFVAEQNRRIIAYVEVTEDGENYITSTPAMKNICGAYCMPECRGQNIVQGLLDHIVHTLHGEGHTLLGVDCESFNPTALNFWTKHFSVYTHSLVRRIDENAVLEQ